MTGPDNGQTGTRPISVAELLAKNGTIGAPPVGGRRRRRRGNSDAVTVAELTGEIPVVRTGELPVVTEETPAAETPTAEAEPELREPLQPSAEPLPRRGPMTAPERSHYPRPARKRDRSGAELMSPDPIDSDAADAELAVDLAESTPDELGLGDASYLRSSDDALFGGDSVADDAARRRGGGAARGLSDLGELDDLTADEVEALDETGDERAEDEAGDAAVDDAPLTRGQQVMRGAVVALQSIAAVAFGGGLFIAFDQLWKWNSLVALVLGVLVILGLVVGVRIVRKTEDIGSTLTAVAVGALVTFGPLALLQAS
ncbi:hypothetical protein [[Mycobacterium] wendilense]|uniref:Transmembrane protein n=1 Tax=[Mycobacterium] wendilense TaxID=3064284 RepID=A0ABN9P2K3_9MYCO|nr:hypothetical protein [Mycolicibacterium sp. MU0050]CAJ1585628.1 hypothetical protein MU0050_003822 [Mycolicibacterium sp. MU0050]